MARQAGIVPFTGTLGGIVFYYHKQYGYLARRKGGVEAKRIREDEAFTRSRENSAEFGHASRCGRVVRRALHKYISPVADSTMVNRLTATLLRALQADATSPRGQRTVHRGAPGRLTGFSFNAATPLDALLALPYTAFDPGSFTLRVDVNTSGVTFPEGATHVRVSTLVLGINFETLHTGLTAHHRLLAPAEARNFTGSFEHEVDPAASHALVMVGIEFYQAVAGTQARLLGKSHTAMQVVSVYAVAP